MFAEAPALGKPEMLTPLRKIKVCYPNVSKHFLAHYHSTATYAGSTEMKHSGALPLLNMLALLDSDITSGHLVHSDTNKAHESNIRVVGLHEDDSPRSHVRDVRLTARQPSLGLRRIIRVDNRRTDLLRKVGPIGDESLLDGSRARRMPAVVAESGQESLIDSTADELRGQGVAGHHVREGVFVAFSPEFVDQLNVVLEVEGLGFAGVDDDAVVVGRGGLAVAILELAGEEVWVALARRAGGGRWQSYDPKSCSRRLGAQGRT
jgi:hypothetical protein